MVLAPLPPQVLFSTSAARTRLYDRFVSAPKGLGRLDTGAGKTWKSRGMQLQGGS